MLPELAGLALQATFGLALTTIGIAWLDPASAPWAVLAAASAAFQSDEAAARLLRAALTRTPENALLHYRLGIVERSLGREEAAVRAFERARSLDPAMRSPDPPTSPRNR